MSPISDLWIFRRKLSALRRANGRATKEQLKRLNEPDFCVRLNESYDSEVLEWGRPFVERFLNPATIDGSDSPLMLENLDVASIFLDAITLARDRENKEVLNLLSPVFESEVSPRLKAETARLVTTLPLEDQGKFVNLWKDFYKKKAHPDVHEEIIKCAKKAEEDPCNEPRASTIRKNFSHDFEGHRINHIRGGSPSEDISLISLVMVACPLEMFLSGLSEVLFLFPEDQRLEKTKGVLAQYPRITQPIDVLNYIMEEGEIDKELHRLITFLSSYGNGDFETEGSLPSIMWWFAGVSPIITIQDLKDVDVKVREVLKANQGIIDFSEFHGFLRAPYLRWDAQYEKTS